MESTGHKFRTRRISCTFDYINLWDEKQEHVSDRIDEITKRLQDFHHKQMTEQSSSKYRSIRARGLKLDESPDSQDAHEPARMRFIQPTSTLSAQEYIMKQLEDHITI